MDYNAAPFTKVRDGCKVYWDSRKQSARQLVFCDVIGDLESELSPSPCDKKCSELRTSYSERLDPEAMSFKAIVVAPVPVPLPVLSHSSCLLL